MLTKIYENASFFITYYYETNEQTNNLFNIHIFAATMRISTRSIEEAEEGI